MWFKPAFAPLESHAMGTKIRDNRCTMHRRDAFDPASRRTMHLTQCKGLPVVEAPDGAHPHPRWRQRAALS